MLAKYNVVVNYVNSYEDCLKKISDDELKNEFLLLKNKVKNTSLKLDSALPIVYAIVREVSSRVLNMRHYDVQILGGVALYYGKVTEIATGEGKTLVATLPICLYSLIGKSIHVVTVNDYLAKRDSEWMNPIYNFLDISVGIICNGISSSVRKISYNSNVVYGTSNEFAFDYLKDNIVLSKDEKVQGELFYSIVDEVDSVLIDEARTPLIISIPNKFDSNLYVSINKLAKKLTIYDPSSKEGHFILDKKGKQVQLTDFGFSYLENLLKKFNIFDKSLNLYNSKNIELLYDIYASLKAIHFFKKDVDYIVKDGNILIVDEHTGRILDGRRWGDGIHQAIEAKEKVHIKSETQTLASITFQNYFRLYNKLSGMTGTAFTESIEFRSIYDLEVFVVPSNKPNIRIDNSDFIFLTKKAKITSIVNDIKKCYFKGQPILVGTISIAVSEFLSTILKNLKIKHNVLNAKYHDKESYIISEAGKMFSVTIATNMAGRGTDIVLGGKSGNKNDYNKVVSLGGLKIIGTERHESRRIDNQLRGRSGRQGDPGCSQFYISLEDDLVKIFIGDKAKILLDKLNIPDNEMISHSVVSKSIENAQKKVESYNFDIRKQLLEFDDIINEQRVVIYDYRNYLIFSEKMYLIVCDIFNDVMDNFIDNFSSNDEEYYNIKEFLNLFNIKFGFDINLDIDILDKISLKKIIFKKLLYDYKIKKNIIKEKNEVVFEKYLLLNILDVKWKEHLLNLDYLKKGIHLRSYAQKDPKEEYKREAFNLFKDMLTNIKYEFIILFFKMSVKSHIDDIKNNDNVSNLDFKHSEHNSFSNKQDQSNMSVKKKPFVRKKSKIGRNELCFCKSKKKYKHCHGKIIV